MRQKLLGLRAAGPRSEPATQRAHARHACNGPRAKPLPTLPLLLGLFGKSERVSAHRGPRQPWRRPNAAEFVSARERVRFALGVLNEARCQARQSNFPISRMNSADAKRPRCRRVSVASAAFGRRRSCRAPRWGETRKLFQSKKGSSGRVGRGLARGPLQAWRACARCEASSERGPIAFYPSNFDRAPAEPGRSGRGSAGHVTARQAPVRPAAREVHARNARRASGGPKRRRQSP